MLTWLPSSATTPFNSLGPPDSQWFARSLLGWRYGFVPSAGNPRQWSITEFEYREAEELKKPRLIFLVDEAAGWPPKFVDKGPAAERVKAFRDEVTGGRLVSFFASDYELAEKVTAAVVRWERREAPTTPTPQSSALALRIRGTGQPLALPDDPYPLLEPYAHPATFGGRDADLDELERRVRKPQLVLCVHAPSGAGKSSLLQAGLVPRLRDRGYAVSFGPAPGRARSRTQSHRESV